MNPKEIQQISKRISENTKNRELLEKILKLSKLSRAFCSELMIYKHGSSFDHYVYRFKEETFPPEFSYLFLNAVFYSFYPKHTKSMKKKKNYVEFIKKNKKELWRKQRIDFFKLIVHCNKQEIRKKIITPALEFHALSLIRLGNFKSKERKESFVDSYLKIINPEAFDYLEDPDENLQENLPSKKYNQYQKLVESLKNFFPIIEQLREVFMRNFIPPHEYTNIKIENLYSIDGIKLNETMMFTKSFLRDELGLSNLDNLFMIKVNEDNMEGTFELNDKVLIKRHTSYIAAKKEGTPSETLAHNWKDGVYAIETNREIKLRRLQFLYSDWRQSTLFPNEKKDVEIPEFLQKEANAEINRVFAKGIEKVTLSEIDELVHKYGIHPLLREKSKPLIDFDDSQDALKKIKDDDYYYGKKVTDHSKNMGVMVNVICDNNKYPPETVKFENLLICGEVLWKSSNFKDKKKYVGLESRLPPSLDLDILFADPIKLKEIA